MHRRILAIIGLLAGLGFLLGWSFFSPSPEEYYPLKQGMVWKYRSVEQKITQATKANPPEPQSFSITITVSPPQELKGKKVIPRKIVREGQEKPSFIYLANDGDGFYWSAQKFPNVEEIHYFPIPIYIFRLPLTPGNSWKERLPGGSESAYMDCRIESLDAEVKVPAGTFKNCLKVKKSGSQEGEVSVLYDAVFWYAPGVGMVKTLLTMSRQTFSQKIDLELESFTK